VVHVGDTVSAGHYVAYMRPDGDVGAPSEDNMRLWRADDKEVTMSSEDDLMEDHYRGACVSLLFYEAADPPMIQYLQGLPNDIDM
jgi:hypothetical protein